MGFDPVENLYFHQREMNIYCIGKLLSLTKGDSGKIQRRHFREEITGVDFSLFVLRFRDF